MNNPIQDFATGLRKAAEDMTIGASMFEQAVEAGDTDAANLHIAIAVRKLDELAEKYRNAFAEYSRAKATADVERWIGASRNRL